MRYGLQKPFFWLLSAFVIAGILIVGSNEQRSTANMKKKHLKNTPDALKQALLDQKIKRRAEGYAKPDQPEKFDILHREIRTQYGKKLPDYPMGYKNIEMERAGIIRREGEKYVRNQMMSSSTLSWTSRGPSNFLGRARGLVVDPDDANHLTYYLGSVGGGIWKTTNGGSYWENLTPEFPNLSTTVIAMASSNHNIMYAGTGEGYQAAVGMIKGDGIFKSTNRGASWAQLSSTSSNSDFAYVNRLIIDPANPDIVVAGTNSAIMRTTDGGTNWTKVHTAGNNRIQQVLADPTDFNIQYATAEALGFLKSTDAGATWASSSTGIGVVDRLEMAIAPSNTNLLYASVESGTNSVLYRSTNGGANWVAVPDTTGQSASSIAWLGAQGWYDNTIAVHPYDPNILFVGGIDIYRINISNSNAAGRRGTTKMTNWYAGLSRPGGGTYPFIHADQHNIVMIPISEPNNFWILHNNDGGFARSTDGGQTWLFNEEEPKGIVTAQFYGVDKMPGASAYIGGTQDNGTWMSPVDATVDSAWIAMLGGDGYDGVWKADDPNQVIGCLYDNRLYKTTDGGETWNTATSGLLDVNNANSAFVTEIGRSKLDPDLLIVPGGSGFWRSEDFGDSWTLAPITSNYGFSTARNLAEISLADPNIVWAGTNMSGAGKLHVSTNAGKSYTATNNYTTATLGRVTGIATHPYNPNEAFALFSIADKPKVLRTMDRGQTWTDISGFGANSSSNNGFPDVATYSLLVMPTDTNEIWAGTEIGIFRSTDNGTTWAYANNGLPAVSVWELKIVDNEIVAATHGRGIWTAPISAPPLPSVVLGPTLKQVYQSPATGLVNVELGLRNTYDSTIVFMGNTRTLTLGPTGINDSTVSFSTTQTGSVSIKASSYKSGALYETVAKSVTLVQAVARDVYYNAFNTSTSANGEFTGTLFSASKPSGFSSFALHTVHPYTNNTNNTFQLNYPITVANDSSMIVFDEIAIVEPGEPGVPFPEPEFWDYVVVEATSDGISWEPIIDGWDCRANSTWLSTFNSGGSGSNSMFKQRRIDLTDKYEPGTKVFIRFRMFADAASTGWGWSVDNLKINALETPPTVTVGALASPVINVAKFAVSSNRGMSTAALTAGGQSVALSRLGGSLFFGSYSITSGTVSITATCSDSVGNTSTTLNKQFTVTPLSKSSSLGGYSVTGSGEGYVVASLVQATDIPSGWIEIGSMYEAGITGTPTNLKITYDLPNESTLDRMIPGSSQRYKIGLYEKDGNQWKLISAESNGKLSGEFSHKAIAAFYNPDFEGIPTEFALSQNYPNPFNPRTTIRYDVAKAGKVVIKVYNMLGQEVATLINAQRDPGRYSIQWDGRNNAGSVVASGVYLYRMQVGDVVRSKRMLFLK